mmetsp:Transcript_18191/g.25882  ORF Transcript_18191/g.25882 Transcript_18191/m.25882 type:complete len:342 (-) Transcript_18191:175-1200(-)
MLGIRSFRSLSLCPSSTRAYSSGPKKVAFIGLGNMGSHMCHNLLKKRKDTNNTIIHSVYAYDIHSPSLKSLAEAGAIPLSSLSEMSDADIVITMLPDDAAVNIVLTDLIHVISKQNTKQKNVTFIDCSTIGPVLSKELHAKVLSSSSNSSASFSMLDAPVSGGVNGAKNATLTFMVGGSKDTLDNVQPVLSCMGKSIIHCGPSSMGIVAKLSNNLALATQMIGICEAMNFGTSLGIDPIVLANVMNTSTAKCWSCEVNNPHPLVAANNNGAASRNYEGGFASSLMLKDVGLAVKAGDSSKVALPFGSLAKELYTLVDNTGNGKKDFSIMMEFLRGNLGKNN